jgi:hypothetical protein
VSGKFSNFMHLKQFDSITVTRINSGAPLDVADECGRVCFNFLAATLAAGAAATLAAGATGQQQQLRPLAEGEDSSSASSMDEDTEEADGIEPVGDTMMGYGTTSGAKLDERGGAGMPKSKQKKKNKGKGGGKTRSRSPKIGPRTTKSAQ